MFSCCRVRLLHRISVAQVSRIWLRSDAAYAKLAAAGLPPPLTDAGLLYTLLPLSIAAAAAPSRCMGTPASGRPCGGRMGVPVSPVAWSDGASNTGPV